MSNDIIKMIWLITFQDARFMHECGQLGNWTCHGPLKNFVTNMNGTQHFAVALDLGECLFI